MRRLPAAALILLAACGSDDGESGIDLDEVRAEISGPVDAPGSVLGVSSRGEVLVSNDDVCLLDTDGTELDCWSPATRPQPGSIIRWSPDGTRLAFDQYANLRTLSGSAVHVLDIATGDVRMVSAGGDEVAVLPAWVDDDELAFARLTDDQRVDVVYADIVDDDREVVPTDVAFQDVGLLAGAIGGDYLMSVRRGDTTEVVAVDEDGTRRLADVDSPAVTFTGSSRDGDEAVLAVPDVPSSFSPITFLGDDGEVVHTEFEAWSGTVAPAGRTVAAVTVDGDSFEASLVLWDPDAGDMRRLDDPDDPGDIDGGFRGVVWTDDDRVVMWSAASWQVATLTTG